MQQLRTRRKTLRCTFCVVPSRREGQTRSIIHHHRRLRFESLAFQSCTPRSKYSLRAVANLADVSRAMANMGNEYSISGPMTLALTCYSAVFMRYALAVTPKNYLLFGCHIINFSAQLTQGYRYINYWKYVRCSTVPNPPWQSEKNGTGKDGRMPEP